MLNGNTGTSSFFGFCFFGRLRRLPRNDGFSIAFSKQYLLGGLAGWPVIDQGILPRVP